MENRPPQTMMSAAKIYRLMFRGLTIIMLLLGAWGAKAQQEPIFAQFMLQKVIINPGAVGGAGHPCFTFLNRKQWLGIEGSPITQAFNFQAPMFAERVGIGFTIVNDNIGFFNTSNIIMQYAYRIDTDYGGLGVGLQGTIKRFYANWDATQTIESADPAIAGIGKEVRPIYNVGFGGYFEARRWYVGASIPNYLQQKKRSDTDVPSDGSFSGETPHAYLMAGLSFDVGRDAQLRPAALVKLVKNAPLNIDFNLTLGLQEKVWMGMTYRYSNSDIPNAKGSMDLIFNYQISEQFRAGLGYGLALSNLQKKNGGSFEFMLGYCLIREGKGIRNPRFFQ